MKQRPKDLADEVVFLKKREKDLDALPCLRSTTTCCGIEDFSEEGIADCCENCRNAYRAMQVAYMAERRKW